MFWSVSPDASRLHREGKWCRRPVSEVKGHLSQSFVIWVLSGGGETFLLVFILCQVPGRLLSGLSSVSQSSRQMRRSVVHSCCDLTERRHMLTLFHNL